MNRYDRVSGRAELCLDNEEDEASTSPIVMTRILDLQREAASRKRTEGKLALQWLARMVIAYFICIQTFWPTAHWLGNVLFWVTVGCGLASMEHFYRYRCARIESSLLE